MLELPEFALNVGARLNGELDVAIAVDQLSGHLLAWFPFVDREIADSAEPH